MEPQRNEKQEWTPEYVGSLVGEFGTFNGAWVIAAAHNAALADEREDRALVEKDLHDALRDAADERQRREQAELASQDWQKAAKEINGGQWISPTDLVALFLSAQAAIEKAKTLCVRDKPFDALEALNSVDLSLLHQHDDEVRKPLVEILTHARPIVFNAISAPGSSPWQVDVRTKVLKLIDDALAKVKEGK